MLRTGATRAVVRSLRPTASPAARVTHNVALSHSQLAPSTRSLSRWPHRATLTPYKPVHVALNRYATNPAGPPYDKTDVKEEQNLQKQKLEPKPEDVSTMSTVRGALGAGHKASDPPGQDVDMMAGVKQDLKTVKETFELKDVPREAYYIGLAGVIPYLATSLTTSYLAYDINHAYHGGFGAIVDGKTAEALLHVLEPIQIGYGAVILSFLGAIHWGLEFAGYGGHHSYRRYAIGVVAPAVAWPTIFLPVDYALIAQFLAFNFLYFVDARTTTRGWSPPWYSIYRFVLTFVVGASIAVSLVGRGQIADQMGTVPGPAQKMRELRDAQWKNLEEDEAKAKASDVRKEREEAAAGGDEGSQEKQEEMRKEQTPGSGTPTR